jgi:hypothetical protein
VKDPSGAVVNQAAITITNTGENTARTLQTDGTGNYEALNLKPGSYSVTVKHPGFDEASRSRIVLDARQTSRIDFTLNVGSQKQVVSVESDAGVIASETDAISSSYGSDKISTLPANFRASTSTSPYACAVPSYHRVYRRIRAGACAGASCEASAWSALGDGHEGERWNFPRALCDPPENPLLQRTEWLGHTRESIAERARPRSHLLVKEAAVVYDALFIFKSRAGHCITFESEPFKYACNKLIGYFAGRYFEWLGQRKILALARHRTV